MFETSVGSNPKITNFELLRTLEVELRTLSNPGLPTKTELRTHPNPPKILNSEPTNWVRPNTKLHWILPQKKVSQIIFDFWGPKNSTRGKTALSKNNFKCLFINIQHTNWCHFRDKCHDTSWYKYIDMNFLWNVGKFFIIFKIEICFMAAAAP